MWELVIVFGVLGLMVLSAILGGVNGDDDETAAAPVLRPDPPRRQLTALRTPASRAEVYELRSHLTRLESRSARRRVEPFLCGLPVDRELEAAASLRNAAQRCEPGEVA